MVRDLVSENSSSPFPCSSGNGPDLRLQRIPSSTGLTPSAGISYRTASSLKFLKISSSPPLHSDLSRCQSSCLSGDFSPCSNRKDPSLKVSSLPVYHPWCLDTQDLFLSPQARLKVYLESRTQEPFSPFCTEEVNIFTNVLSWLILYPSCIGNHVCKHTYMHKYTSTQHNICGSMQRICKKNAHEILQQQIFMF